MPKKVKSKNKLSLWQSVGEKMEEVWRDSERRLKQFATDCYAVLKPEVMLENTND